MSFRSRILLGSVLTVWIPLLVLALVIRGEMTRRLTGEYTRRVESLIRVIEEDLAGETERVRARLAGLGKEIAADNRFRLVEVEGMGAERGYILDYAGKAMNLLGLSMLQIQDVDGRIASSGHFRNEYDRLEPALLEFLNTAPGGRGLVRARLPGGDFLALCALDSVRLGGKTFALVGGTAVNERFLARLVPGRELAVSLIAADRVLSSDPALRDALGRGREEKRGWESTVPASRFFARAFPLPLAPIEGVEPPSAAQLLVSHSLESLHRTRRNLDLWLAAVMAAVVLGTLLLGAWVSSWLTRPLAELAQATSRLDLDRLRADFPGDRSDEIGVLGRFLNQMTGRLRASAHKLREAERRIALGELARQVNHDVRNGLTPLRNVLRHLGEVAEKEPERLGPVFQERAGVLESSLGYLESLAENYSRLSRRPQAARVNVNALVRAVSEAMPEPGGVSRVLGLDSSLPEVIADPVALRRVLENLLTNAGESFEGREGTVTVATTSIRDEEGRSLARITIEDTGKGIPAEELDRIFDDFYTTKETGMGLGLSIVRRLVADCGGAIRAQSEVGKGTRFLVELPLDPGPSSPDGSPARGAER